MYHLHTLGSGDLCEGLTSIPQQGLFVPFACVGSGDPVRVLCLFHNKVYLYRLHKQVEGLFVPFACIGSSDPVRVLCLFHNKVYLYRLHKQVEGLFVPFARVGSGDPVRVLCLFHNKYSGYCCIHLLCKAMYNLSLPRLSANYYGLPTTAQLRAAHESRCSLFGVSRSTGVTYCTVPVLNGILSGPFIVK